MPSKSSILFSLLFMFQSQSQGSITLKIIPAIKEEDRLRESKVSVGAEQDQLSTDLPYSQGLEAWQWANHYSFVICNL